MTTPLSDERIAEIRERLRGAVTDDLWCESTEVRQIGRDLLAEVSRLRARIAELEATNDDATE